MWLADLALTWVRVSTLFLAARHVFGLPGVPGLTRLGLSGLVAALLASLLPPSQPAALPAPVGQGPGWAAWALAVGQEVGVGLVMAFGVEAMFAAVLVAGQLVDLPMGLSVVNVIDPTLQQETPLIGQFYLLLATLIFFAIDGHHQLILALAESLRRLPPGQAGLSAAAAESAVAAVSQAFLLGLRMAMPVVAALFLADVALAVVARAVPQLNVFVVGFPVKLVLGLAVLWLALPGLAGAVEGLFGEGGVAWDAVGRLLRVPTFP